MVRAARDEGGGVSATPEAAGQSRSNLYSAFGLAAVAMLAYLDWITHRQVVVSVLLAVIAGGAIVFRQQIVESLNLGPFLAQIPAPARPVLAAAPAVLYFLIRGQGTSGAGGVVLIAILLVVGAIAVFGRLIDAKLAGFYAARNRILPLPARMVLALVLPVLVAFLVIHGSLADLPALWGGTTNHPMSPAGREGLFLLGSVLSAALAYLLLREGAVPEGEAAPASGAAEQPASAPSSGWLPTHAVPPGGLQAWGSPDPATPVAANLDAGLPLRVLERAGDWARVEASNGWTGWVDGRRLEQVGG